MEFKDAIILSRDAAERIREALRLIDAISCEQEEQTTDEGKEAETKMDDWRSDFTPKMISDFKKGKFGYIVRADKTDDFQRHLHSVAPDIRWNRNDALREWHPPIRKGYAVYSMLSQRNGLTYDEINVINYDVLKEHKYFVCAEGCDPYELVAKGHISVLIRSSDEYIRFIDSMKEHGYSDLIWAETGLSLFAPAPIIINSPYVIDIYDEKSALLLPASIIDTKNERNENRLVFDIAHHTIRWLCNECDDIVTKEEGEEEDDHECIDNIVTEFVNGRIGIIVHDEDEWLSFASLVEKKHRELTWNSKAKLRDYIPMELQLGEAIFVTAKSSICLDTNCNNRVCYYHGAINKIFKDAAVLDGITTFYDVASGCCINARDPKNITICSLCKMH